MISNLYNVLCLFNEIVSCFQVKILNFSHFLVTTALAHYHAAISIDINDTISNEDNKREFRHYNNNSIGLSDLTNDTDVSPCALKKAHIKESIACHEEAQRLQRMSRDLKVKTKLIFCLNFHLF